MLAFLPDEVPPPPPPQPASARQHIVRESQYRFMACPLSLVDGNVSAAGLNGNRSSRELERIGVECSGQLIRLREARSDPTRRIVNDGRVILVRLRVGFRRKRANTLRTQSPSDLSKVHNGSAGLVLRHNPGHLGPQRQL